MPRRRRPAVPMIATAVAAGAATGAGAAGAVAAAADRAGLVARVVDPAADAEAIVRASAVADLNYGVGFCAGRSYLPAI